MSLKYANFLCPRFSMYVHVLAPFSMSFVCSERKPRNHEINALSYFIRKNLNKGHQASVFENIQWYF